ncbi:ABC transporter ATP-binding protein [Promicromonospora soli]
MNGELRIEGLRAGYAGSVVVDGLSLTIAPGEVVAMLGRNGVGKSTTASAISGTLEAIGGSVAVDGRDVTGSRPSHRYDLGLRVIRQDRPVIGDLSVADNLRLVGAGVTDASAIFPFLEGRGAQKAGTLSGGEQKMLAVARQALDPGRYWILDEPTEGLQPKNVDHVRDLIRGAAAEGTGVLLIEQHLTMALAVADRWCLVEKGQIVGSGAVDEHTYPTIASSLAI